MRTAAASTAWGIAIAVLGIAGVWALRRLLGGYRPRDPARPLLAPREAAVLEAAAEALYPPGGPVPLSGGDADLAGYVDGYLAMLPAATRRLVRLLLLAFEQATLLFPAPGHAGRRRFSSLTLEQRVQVLEGWRTSSLFFRRLAFTSLRALLTMAYFAHPAVLRRLELAPLAIETPPVWPDRLYPPVGKGREAIVPSGGPLADASPRGPAGLPMDPHGPLHPDYRGPEQAG